jgi:SAM-dependent methyltransferase
MNVQHISPKETFVWNPEGAIEAVCPACGETGPKAKFLEAPSLPRKGETVTLVHCPACGSRFIADLEPAEYGKEETSEFPLRFYVEQGAGIDQLAQPAFAIAARGDIGRYLEIGCGYGFGIDFAARSFGWDARGIDPSLIARRGAADLGIRIDSAYLEPGQQDEVGLFGAIVAMEVIEHIPDPVPFLEMLRSYLTPGGCIYMSTPTASVLDDRANPMLVPVVCAGYHTTIFSRDGLARAMERAGFDNVRVDETPSSLFAAGTLGGAPLDVDLGVERERYVRYLRERKDLHEPGSMLWTAFSYRLFKELVNGGRHADASAYFQSIASGLRQARGLDLADPRGIIGVAASTSERLHAGDWPFCLAGLLYLRGINLINLDWAPEPAFPYFLAALDVGHKIRAALLEWGADDGELQDQLRAAEKGLLLCLERLGTR